MTDAMPRGRRSALVVVDVQNDFCTGSLAVPGATAVVPAANRLRAAARWELVALTQDWHPAGHASFHSTHARRHREAGGAAADAPRLFGEATLQDGQSQVLWPDHCVQGTEGAAFAPGLEVREGADLVVRKGLEPGVDSYSAFFDNARRGETELRAELRGRGVTDVYVCGLALDYCVGFTALDAASLGFRTHVVLDAARAVAPESEARMLARLARAGVALVHVASVESGNHGPRADAEDYLARHGVQRLFESLCASLLLERPPREGVRAFLAGRVDAIREAGGGAPTLLDADDVANSFAAMDPAGTGELTARQAATALVHMGADAKDVPAPRPGDGAGEPVPLERFRELAAEAGVV